ncbi:MAG: hypothetical protein ACFFD4_26765 [Candidatus Odinarchaeota archaeon]
MNYLNGFLGVYTAIPCQTAITLNTDHSAYFPAPDELTIRSFPL